MSRVSFPLTLFPLNNIDEAESSDSDNEDEDDMIDNFFKVIKADRPNSDDKPQAKVKQPIKLINQGVQLCIFNYNTLPRIGGCILSMTITIYCP
jgi:hypothetical protein